MDAAQYADDKDEDATGFFFMRVSFACALPAEQLHTELGQLAQGFGMHWSLQQAEQPMKTVLMVSREGHCLNHLLLRWNSDLLKLDVRAIISNFDSNRYTLSTALGVDLASPEWVAKRLKHVPDMVLS